MVTNNKKKNPSFSRRRFLPPTGANWIPSLPSAGFAPLFSRGVLNFRIRPLSVCVCLCTYGVGGDGKRLVYVHRHDRVQRTNISRRRLCLRETRQRRTPIFRRNGTWRRDLSAGPERPRSRSLAFSYGDVSTDIAKPERPDSLVVWFVSRRNNEKQRNLKGN